MKIEKEQVFSVPSNSFAISPSNEEYTLNYSVTGEDWSEYSEATPADTNAVVNFGVRGMMYKLVGNDSTVYITY